LSKIKVGDIKGKKEMTQLYNREYNIKSIHLILEDQDAKKTKETHDYHIHLDNDNSTNFDVWNGNDAPPMEILRHDMIALLLHVLKTQYPADWLIANMKLKEGVK
jgi:ADP-dependent phosphofructokinase/glucokinase